MTIVIKLLAHIITIGCCKGGVTKTTTTVNLSYEISCLAKKKYWYLISMVKATPLSSLAVKIPYSIVNSIL